ncbi:MAG: TlpA family protein disulfide reductase [Chthoniobacterales bacterium]
MKRSLFFYFAILLSLFFVSEFSRAAEPTPAQKTSPEAKAWAAITALDRGPQKKPRSRDEAKRFFIEHLQQQEKLLKQYVQNYPKEEHAFEAQLRLIRTHAAIGTFQGDRQARDNAYDALGKLESSPGITRQQAADAGFARVSILFQKARQRQKALLESVVAAARHFYHTYPDDPRSARVLVEAATICDKDPPLKQQLLETALQSTREDELKQRIYDDLKRLGQLGRAGKLNFPTLKGPIYDLSKQRGKVVVLIFWSANSPHSLIWMKEFLTRAEALSKKKNFEVVSFCVDENRAEAEEMVKALQLPYPVGFDGKGWNSKTVRESGINAIPTVWIYDQQGILRTLNARDDYEQALSKLAPDKN